MLTSVLVHISLELKPNSAFSYICIDSLKRMGIDCTNIIKSRIWSVGGEVTYLSSSWSSKYVVHMDVPLWLCLLGDF